MAFSLYEATVPSYARTVSSIAAVLDKGKAHVEATGGAPDALAEARLHEDMRPLRFQIVSVIHHSCGALEALKTGVFTPPTDQTPYDYAGLQRRLAEARETLEAVSAEEIDARSGADVTFIAGERRVPFTAEGFVASFSLPNFYFHATTAYDILRSKGVPIGKRDYLGRLLLKA